MLSYKEVFQLAIDKGYTRLKLDCEYFTLYPFIDNEAADLLMLALIQKWLRDTHKICVVAAPCATDRSIYFFQITFLSTEKFKSAALGILNELFEDEKRKYKGRSLKEFEEMNLSYESALQLGIHEALKLIKL